MKTPRSGNPRTGDLSSVVTFRTARRYGSGSSTVAADLGEHIVAGRIPPGTVLRAEFLAAEYEVSQTPVREALQTLVAEGLVRKEPGTGYTVAPLTAADVSDVFLMAAFVAGELAARAVDTLTPDDLSELRAIHHETMALVHRGDLENLDQKSRAFHTIVNQSSVSPKLRWMARLTTRFVPRSLFPEIPGWVRITVEGQQAMLQALDAKDADAARQAARTTLSRAGQALSAEVAARSATDSDPS